VLAELKPQPKRFCVLGSKDVRSLSEMRRRPFRNLTRG